ncbi:hypothetical protein OF83DRAFT_1156335, partial [Amylostereum chailletii]
TYFAQETLTKGCRAKASIMTKSAVDPAPSCAPCGPTQSPKNSSRCSHTALQTPVIILMYASLASLFSSPLRRQ